jgi:hypothetical protein
MTIRPCSGLPKKPAVRRTPRPRLVAFYANVFFKRLFRLSQRSVVWFMCPRQCMSSLTRDSAMALARRLQQFWHDQGHPMVRFWAEPIAGRFTKVGTYELYRANSNLINGLPPRYRNNTI